MHIGAASAPFVYVIERNHQSLASDQHLEPCHRIQPPRYQTLGYVYKTLAPTAPMHTPAISGVPSPPVRTPPCPLSHEDVVEVSGLEPPPSTLRTCLRRIPADSGESSGQVSELSTRLRTEVNGSVRGMVAG